jgi:DNA invertase Pin-like site-specific DNA recombinase
MRIGYARVSTQDQSLDLQRDALKAARCDRIIEDIGSGQSARRVGLDQLRDVLRKGDVLVVWRLDRLGRSLRNLIEILTELEQQGIGFHSLQESIDTTTPGGKLVFHIFGALAEFERNLIRERTHAGLTAARARGRKGGRPTSLNQAQQKLAVQLYEGKVQLYEGKEQSVMEICEFLGISKPTLYAYLRSSQHDKERVRKNPAQ